jgi:hypothetical protein
MAHAFISRSRKLLPVARSAIYRSSPRTCEQPPALSPPYWPRSTFGGTRPTGRPFVVPGALTPEGSRGGCPVTLPSVCLTRPAGWKEVSGACLQRFRQPLGGLKCLQISMRATRAGQLCFTRNTWRLCEEGLLCLGPARSQPCGFGRRQCHARCQVASLQAQPRGVRARLDQLAGRAQGRRCWRGRWGRKMGRHRRGSNHLSSYGPVAFGCCARISVSARLASVRGRYSYVSIRSTPPGKSVRTG